MKVLYGTTNQAKVITMEKITKPLGIEMISLRDLECDIPVINETGKTPLENAQIKAKTYYEAFHVPVFSCDSGLYFEEVADDKQPGIHVRRVGGRELNDEEMICYYSALAEQHGGKLTACYRNAICFIIDGKTVYSSMDPALATEPFWLVSKPHEKRVEGFPLDSLSKDRISGNYYYDLKTKEVSTSAMEQGFKQFFAECLKGRDEVFFRKHRNE